MKPRKAEPGTRRAAQATGKAPKRAQRTAEPRVTGLERDGEIRLTQLLRALGSGTTARIKSAY